METYETWMPVPDYEGLYRVSDWGRIESLERKAVNSPLGGKRRVRARILKEHRDKKSGHCRVRLAREGKQKTLLVHHLVLTAFVEPQPEGKESCHFDDVAWNNRLENLRWDTRRSNRADAIRNGVKFGRKKKCAS